MTNDDLPKLPDTFDHPIYSINTIDGASLMTRSFWCWEIKGKKAHWVTMNVPLNEHSIQTLDSLQAEYIQKIND